MTKYQKWQNIEVVPSFIKSRACLVWTRKMAPRGYCAIISREIWIWILRNMGVRCLRNVGSRWYSSFVIVLLHSLYRAGYVHFAIFGIRNLPRRASWGLTEISEPTTRKFRWLIWCIAFSAECRVPVSRPNSHFSVEIILPSVAGIGSESNRNPGTVSISDMTSHCKISWSLEAARLVV